MQGAKLHYIVQVIMSEGLAQGPYVASRVEFEPAAFLKEGVEPTTEPPSP